MTSSSFIERLEQLRGGESARAFAQRAGLPEGTYRAWLKGGKPTMDALATLSDRIGVSIDWLVTGEGAMRRGQPAQIEGPGKDFALVPRLSVYAGAGNGLVAQEEEVTGVLAFREEWLHRMGINVRAARILEAKGDSMEPTIRDGDVLLVDTSIDRVIDNAIYVVVYGGNVLVKRVQLKLDGSVVLRSDNAVIFDEETVPAPDVDSLQVAGRVRWFGRSI